jgi:hypothetical protein
MLYYLVSLITGGIVGIFGDEPTPGDGQIVVTTPAPDSRMSWDNDMSAWYWSKEALQNVLDQSFGMRRQITVPVDGHNLDITSSYFAQQVEIAMRAAPSGMQHVQVSSMSPLTVISMTNAEILDAARYVQLPTDVYVQVTADIASGSITDPAGIDSAWASYSASWADLQTYA